MSITIDNATVGPGLSFAHVVGSAAHRYLIVQVNIGPGGVSVSTITYAGVSLTRLGFDNSAHPIDLWGLQEPATGSNQVVITLSGAGANQPAALSFASSNPITPAAAVNAHGTSTTPSITVTGSVGDLIVGGVIGASDVTLTLGEIELWNDEIGDAGAAIVATGLPQLLTWTLLSSGQWAIVAVPLHENIPALSSSPLNLTAIRAAIVQILASIPEIQRVDDTTYKGEANNNMPFAQVLRGPVQMHSLTLTGEEADVQLGSYDYLISWTIRVYCAPGSLPDMQAWDDLMAMRLQEAFNSNRLLQPNGPGVVDNSRIDLVEGYLQEESRPALWITEASLKTFVVASL